MGKKYSAIGAVTLALAASFIAIQGVGSVIEGNASTAANINYINTMNTFFPGGDIPTGNTGEFEVESPTEPTTATNSSATPTVGPTKESTIESTTESETRIIPEIPESTTNAETTGTWESSTGSEEETTGHREIIYGEWKTLKEPTYDEEGIRQRECIMPDGRVFLETRTIPKLERESTTSDRTHESTEPETTRETQPSPSIRRGGRSGRNVQPLNTGETSGENISLPEENTKTSESEQSSEGINTPATVESSTAAARRKELKVSPSQNTFNSKTLSQISENEMPASEIAANEGVKESEKSTVQRESKTAAQIKSSNSGESKEEPAEPETKALQETKAVSNKFNKYDGVTLLAAGAYTWWAAIVLLPMVNAVKWINKKRKEKLTRKA